MTIRPMHGDVMDDGDGFCLCIVAEDILTRRTGMVA